MRHQISIHWDTQTRTKEIKKTFFRKENRAKNQGKTVTMTNTHSPQSTQNRLTFINLDTDQNPRSKTNAQTGRKELYRIRQERPERWSELAKSAKELNPLWRRRWHRTQKCWFYGGEKLLGGTHYLHFLLFNGKMKNLRRRASGFRWEGPWFRGNRNLRERSTALVLGLEGGKKAGESQTLQKPFANGFTVPSFWTSCRRS